jgi:hypothetical protein
MERLFVLMEDYGVLPDLNQHDMRTLVYLSDRAAKARQDKNQQRILNQRMRRRG